MYRKIKISFDEQYLPDCVDDTINKVTISDIEQTHASTEIDGVNVFRVRLGNGKGATLRICNGEFGVDCRTNQDKDEIMKAALLAFRISAFAEIRCRKSVGSVL